jgi:catechol 2,3-dioxygenase-like lactoylglutathione lyase family enzyme
MTLRDATVAVRLPAQDLDRAVAWYRDKLGLEPLEVRDGGVR